MILVAVGSAMLADLIGLTGSQTLVLSQDGRLSIRLATGLAGLLALLAAVLAPLLAGRAGDPRRLRRFRCECHVAGILTLALLLASLDLAPRGAGLALAVVEVEVR